MYNVHTVFLLLIQNSFYPENIRKKQVSDLRLQMDRTGQITKTTPTRRLRCTDHSHFVVAFEKQNTPF